MTAISHRALLLALTLAAWPRGLAAQERIAVLAEAGTPVVAAEILLPVGPADEDAGQAGLAFLAARAVVAPILAALDSIGARLTVVPHKDALSFSVVAPPDAWEAATEIVVEALFREAPDSLSVLQERRTIVAELRGRLANPADAANHELDRAFFGADHPWGRPTVGSPQTVERLRVADVDAFLRTNFTPDRAFAAVAGPVDEQDARTHFRSLLGASLPAAVEMIPFRPASLPLRRDYNSITTWVVASFRFPETGDHEALRFVGYLAADALSFSPARNSIYNVQDEVVRRVGSGELRLQLVVPPPEAREWAERIEDTMIELSGRSFPVDVFEGHLRRYRGERLMPLGYPEARANEAARQLLVEGTFSGLVPDLDGMTPERVRAAARSFGQPTIVLLGPLIDDR